MQDPILPWAVRVVLPWRGQDLAFLARWSAAVKTLLLLSLTVQSLPAATDQGYFRVASGSAPARITGFTADGILRWSNSVPLGQFEIETSDALNGRWRPLSRGTNTQVAMSLKVLELNPPPGMRLIPGGTFLMGDSQGDPLVSSLATPVHLVKVSPFFIDAYEVTNEKMRSLLQWAYDQGLVQVTSTGIYNSQGNAKLLMALGKYNSELFFSNGVFSVRAGRAGFPCVYLSWYGSAAYCQFLSLKEGKETCYEFNEWTCDFTKKGYRMPTEAEWEFAARGGFEGLRFPWDDTNVITHSRANYMSDTNNSYDVSPTRGFHPDYTDNRPRTSPVGTFAPNAFGLFDMAGNVWEWVWDRHARYPSADQVDPVGPDTGSNRIFRGGSWFTKAERLTCAMRYPASPQEVFDDFGLRAVLPRLGSPP